jgi:hypothetical protein
MVRGHLQAHLHQGVIKPKKEGIMVHQLATPSGLSSSREQSVLAPERQISASQDVTLITAARRLGDD